MNTEAKHRQISRELLSEIAANRFAPTGRLPSESQLVEKYGVSRPTVARALRDLQEQGIIERRVGSGSYVRNAVPAAIDNRQLGLLIPDRGTTEIFDVICGEIATLARVHDYGLLWGSSTRRSPIDAAVVEGAERLCDQFIEKKVSGVFFAPIEHTELQDQFNRTIVERLRQNGIAVVLLDRDYLTFPARSDNDLVTIDNFAGGYTLAEHLVRMGCQRFAFVAPPFSAQTIHSRLAGIREALSKFELPPPKQFLHVGESETQKLSSLIEGSNRVDAIICANDRFAALMLRSLEQAGCKVPHDVRLAGFDDVRYASLLSVPLTTMHQPCRDIAVTAFRAMIDRITEPTLPARQLLISARLVIRESCGAYLHRKTPVDRPN